MGSIGITSCPLRDRVDPRALRFSAAATAGVLGIVLLTVGVAQPLALGLLASQIAVFGLTAFVSVHWSVWAQIFARFIWPRLEPVTALADARPVRFGQLVGFLLTTAALLGFVTGADDIGYGLTAVAFAAEVVNATTGVCLGCQLHQLVRRPRSVGA